MTFFWRCLSLACSIQKRLVIVFSVHLVVLLSSTSSFVRAQLHQRLMSDDTVTTPTDAPADNVSVAVNPREALLRRQIEDIKQQISERKERYAQLQQSVAAFPSREELTAAHAQAAETLEATQKELQQVVAQLEPLREPEERAYELCVRLRRLEMYCDKAEEWVETVLRPNVEENIAKEAADSELAIAAFVEELQCRRADALEKLNALRDRISRRAADMRRGLNREPLKVRDGAFNTEVTAAVTDARMERSVSPRPQEYEDIDEETYEISAYNAQIGDELAVLQERLKKLQKLRSKYHSEIVHFRADSKKELAALENSVRQMQGTISRDQRVIQQLHSANAALTSTIQTVMGQLNIEHYGTQVGPMAIEIASRRHDAILERQTARGASKLPSPLALTEGRQ